VESCENQPDGTGDRSYNHKVVDVFQVQMIKNLTDLLLCPNEFLKHTQARS
jgi:hypothetical protein